MRDRWLQLCARLGRGDADDSLWFCLESLYRHPARAYHTLDHVGACLTLLDEFHTQAASPDDVEFAIFLHDCVYVPGRADNETRSARISEAFLTALGAGATRVRVGGDLVRITDHATPPATPDQALIVDLDMAVLGSGGDVYEAYAHGIRREYGHVPDDQFRSGRGEFLRAILRRPVIFRTNAVRARFEVSARANIERELARLSGRAM